MNDEKSQDNISSSKKKKKEFWSKEDMEKAKPYPMPEPPENIIKKK
jgi:hypothetical protein